MGLCSASLQKNLQTWGTVLGFACDDNCRFYSMSGLLQCLIILTSRRLNLIRRNVKLVSRIKRMSLFETCDLHCTIVFNKLQSLLS